MSLEELTRKILMDLMKGKIELLKTEFVEEPALLDREDNVNDKGMTVVFSDTAFHGYIHNQLTTCKDNFISSAILHRFY